VFGVAFTRALASIYGVTLLYLLVRIQTTIISRYLFLNIQLQSEKAADSMFKLEVTTQRSFFAARDYLVQSGLPLLICHIRRAVKEATSRFVL
jgi:hypothetical protein